MKFRFRINKSFREKLQNSEKDYESIAVLCAHCEKSIKYLQKLSVNITKDDRRLCNMFEENIDHWDFCRAFATGEIPQEEWEDYDFDGDLVGLFNSYLSEFYDICDYQIGSDEKLCWVELCK